MRQKSQRSSVRRQDFAIVGRSLRSYRDHVTSVLPRPVMTGERTARPRHYVMCRPEHFDVRYAINPWMRP